ncbi:Hypothetical Protein FCC1311_075392 [Hondaea fermentalgiana]|uniref:Uncharacterized protein n=1 Tax=Hondaea fermentalgiana TaxID=2315210 RepID=A0A2R5GK79_9STRA|nr:Hypothetical Protein FCC1311_075392 [Hondaea fermentalgiana]|eukprot:GBG31316.1 Hypothetical Protein FCC1311_075392 [Hondaea fermentalgiana]
MTTLAMALEAVEEESAALLRTALLFPALVPRKRKRIKVAFANEKIALKRAALEAQREDEDNLRKLRAQQQAAGDERLPDDRVEAEERLKTSIALLKRQTEAREKWASKTVPSSPTHDSESSSLKRSAAETAHLRHRNAWLRHVLTTMMLEAKVNWAAHADLRAVMMGDSIP